MSNLRRRRDPPRTMGRKTPERIGMVGATGLIGRRVIEISSESDAARIVGIARREIELPRGARMEMFVAEPSKWGEVFEAVRPRSFICALGTTWKKAGRDEVAFRAVDQDLIVRTAQGALDAGVKNMVLISAAGADPQSKSLYMKVKGETEQLVSKLGFSRLDILQPGLLRGIREGDFRLAEKLGMMAAPLVEQLLPSKYEMYHSINADIVAEAALGLAMRRAAGRFTHDNESLKRAARDWRTKIERDERQGED